MQFFRLIRAMFGMVFIACIAAVCIPAVLVVHCLVRLSNALTPHKPRARIDEAYRERVN